MSLRTQRIGAELGRAIQQVITRGLSDPRVRGMITVTGVTVSDDLRQATVRVSVYPEEHEELTLHGLSAAGRYIRREAGELVAMARLPQLRFKLDKSLKRQADVLDSLAKANAELDEQRAEDELARDDDRGTDTSDPAATPDASAKDNQP